MASEARRPLATTLVASGGLALLLMVMGAGACGREGGDGGEAGLENEAPATGTSADIALSTRAISVKGVEVVRLACANNEGVRCTPEEEVAVFRCLGLHDCQGTALSVPGADAATGAAAAAALAEVTRRVAVLTRPIRLSLHRAVPYSVLSELLAALAAQGHREVDFVDLDPRWFRGGAFAYRPQPLDPATSSAPVVRILVTHPGNLSLVSNVRGVEPARVNVVDDGLNVAGLQHWFALLPDNAVGADATALISAAGDIRWATLSRIIALTIERLPARGYSYRGALEGALAKRLDEPPAAPLFGARLLAPPPVEAPERPPTPDAQPATPGAPGLTPPPL